MFLFREYDTIDCSRPAECLSKSAAAIISATRESFQQQPTDAAAVTAAFSATKLEREHP